MRTSEMRWIAALQHLYSPLDLDDSDAAAEITIQSMEFPRIPLLCVSHLQLFANGAWGLTGDDGLTSILQG